VLLVWLWTRLAAGPGSAALSSVLTIMVIVGAVLIVGAATMTRELMKRRE
jgi:energy-converting hydrogenase Eha subunit B